MDTSMDIELDEKIDLELEEDPIAKALLLESYPDLDEPKPIKETPASNEVKMAEIDFEGLPRPNAIFLKGVDDMSTTDIKNYCDSTDLRKVEWINDTSCNLVFDNKEEALQVVKSLLVDPNVEMDHKTLHASKSFENADGKKIELSLRLATDEDVKSKGARERSRYYLLHGTEDSEIKAEGRSRAVAERMQKNGGDGRDVFSRLGNKVMDRGHRRQRNRSASPVREVTRKTKEMPEHLKSRLGLINEPKNENKDNSSDTNENNEQ